MTQKELNSAVSLVNKTLATNNPKGLTIALRNYGYSVDNRFDILSYSELNKILSDIYNSNPQQWVQIVKSVPFNYEKTDSSTSPDTKSRFQNIVTSINPSAYSTGKFQLPKWFDDALDIIVGSTETVTVTPATPTKTSPWVYVGYILIVIAIIAIVYAAFKMKSI